MPNITIQVNNPVLTGGAYFKVRYRLKGDVIWTNIANQTNAPFTNLLDVGTYEFEFTYVNGEQICEPTIYEVIVREPCQCLSVSSAPVAKVGSNFIMTLNYSLPSPQPPCGWIIIITNATQNPRTLYYKSLPASTTQIMLVPGDNKISIFSNCCDEVIPTDIGI